MSDPPRTITLLLSRTEAISLSWALAAYAADAAQADKLDVARRFHALALRISELCGDAVLMEAYGLFRFRDRTDMGQLTKLATGASYTPRERRLLFEMDSGACPVCGALRGFSVPDDCADNAQCPEPDDIEASLQ